MGVGVGAGYAVRDLVGVKGQGARVAVGQDAKQLGRVVSSAAKAKLDNFARLTFAHRAVVLDQCRTSGHFKQALNVAGIGRRVGRGDQLDAMLFRGQDVLVLVVATPLRGQSPLLNPRAIGDLPVS